MGNLHRILSDKYEIEALYLLREWEKLQIRDSDYRNHQVLTHRCINKGITPDSIRLKTTVKTEKGKENYHKNRKVPLTG